MANPAPHPAGTIAPAVVPAHALHHAKAIVSRPVPVRARMHATRHAKEVVLRVVRQHVPEPVHLHVRDLAPEGAVQAVLMPAQAIAVTDVQEPVKTPVTAAVPVLAGVHVLGLAQE